jgi:hypothetical protein
MMGLDNHRLPPFAHNPTAFSQDQFNQGGIFIEFPTQFAGIIRNYYSVESKQPAFRFRNDFLRDDEDIIWLEHNLVA